MTEAEIKGKKFLEFVSNNEKKLRKNLKKNVTFEKDIFEDVFQETIIKCYNAIVSNNKDIDDIESYFYIATKFTYILWQNRNRKYIKNKIRLDDFLEKEEYDIEYEIYEEVNTEKLLKRIKEIVEEKFGYEQTEMFFDFMMLKTQGRTSYNDFSEVTGIPVNKITDIIRKIKKFINKNEEINRLNYVCMYL